MWHGSRVRGVPLCPVAVMTWETFDLRPHPDFRIFFTLTTGGFVATAADSNCPEHQWRSEF